MVRVQQAVGIVLVAAFVAAPVSVSAYHGQSCQPTPLGYLCWADRDHDGVPERAFVYPNVAHHWLVFDLDTHGRQFHAFVGSQAIPDRGRLGADYAQTEAATTADPQYRVLRLDVYGPSNIGGTAIFTFRDVDRSGTPERIEWWSFNTRTGESRDGTRTFLP